MITDEENYEIMDNDTEKQEIRNKNKESEQGDVLNRVKDTKFPNSETKQNQITSSSIWEGNI